MQLTSPYPLYPQHLARRPLLFFIVSFFSHQTVAASSCFLIELRFNTIWWEAVTFAVYFHRVRRIKYLHYQIQQGHIVTFCDSILWSYRYREFFLECAFSFFFSTSGFTFTHWITFCHLPIVAGVNGSSCIVILNQSTNSHPFCVFFSFFRVYLGSVPIGISRES